MRVGPQREARIGVAQVLGQGLDRLATVEQHRGIEVPKRVKSLGPLRFWHTGTPQRGDLVAAGVGDALDEPVGAQASQVVGPRHECYSPHLPRYELLR